MIVGMPEVLLFFAAVVAFMVIVVGVVIGVAVAVVA